MSDCQASDWCILQSSSRPKKDLGIRSQQGSGWSCVWFEELRFLDDILVHGDARLLGRSSLNRKFAVTQDLMVLSM